MYYWSDVIELIMQMFDVNQDQIASKLFMSPSAVSKIMHGKQRMTRSVDEVYKYIFDPKEESSFINTIAKFQLAEIKTEIERFSKEMKANLEDCWESNDYETFVRCLLGRAKNPPRVRKTSKTRNTDDKSGKNTNGSDSVETSIAIENQPISTIAISMVTDTEGSTVIEKCGVFDVRISQKDRICATCSKWKGNVQEADCTPEGVYGICKVYNDRNQLSIEGGNCKRYTPNMSLLSQRKRRSQ